MKYSYDDIVKITEDLNKILISIDSDEQLYISCNFHYFSVFSRNVLTKEDTLMVDHHTRDEGYLWLEGFITALLIARPTILEEKKAVNLHTISVKETLPIQANAKVSWGKKIKKLLDVY